MSDSTENIIDIVAEEFAEHLRRGGSPDISRYANAYPAQAEEIRTVLESVLMIEQLACRQKPVRLSAIPARSPEQLGDYRILREIGRGGMGVVFEAEQVTLGRRVAVKVLPPEKLIDPKHAKRFEREARTAGQLHHTNIVPVFGVGQDEGYHYYVMQLIDGAGLDSAPQQNDWQTVARIGIQAADALDYAHAQGTLHRDIKPANLLLDKKGVVRITDFGLARALEPASVSQTNDTVGTLRYMAPEQFSGQADARTDIYSLGLTLYELLAGRPAFDGTSPSNLIRQITHGEMVRLRQILPALPHDLDTILAKATALDAADRYASAGDLAEDLRCVLEDRPIRARQVSAAEQAWRWARRNPWFAAASASSLVLLMAVALLSTIGYFQIRLAYQQVDHALGEARRAGAEAVAAAERTEQERRRTQEEYERADGNLTVALAALDEISDKLASRQLPQSLRLDADDDSWQQATGGLSAEDAEIVQSLLRFYDEFAARNTDGSGVDLAVARVHRRIGDIRARLGQYEQAISAFHQSLKTIARLRDAHPEDTTLLLFEVRTHNARGAAWLKSGDFRRAIELHRYAHELIASHTSPDNHQPTVRYERAQTLQALVLAQAESLYEQNRRGPPRPRRDAAPTAVPEIQAEFEQALQLLESLLQDDPDNIVYRLALARCHRSLLPFAWANQDQAAADNAKQQAIAVLEQLARQNPHDLTIQFELADTLAMTPPPALNRPLSKTDVTVLETALQLAENLHQRVPSAPEYAVLLANIHQKLGSHFLVAKQSNLARDHLTRATGVLEPLTKSFPTNPLFQTSLARARWELADAWQRQNQLEPAREILELAIAEYEAFRDSDTSRRVSAGRWVGLYRQLSRVLEQLGETEQAADIMQAADRLRDTPRQR